MMKAVLCLCVLFGCYNHDKFTWGDICRDFSEEWCNLNYKCGLLFEKQVMPCKIHIYSHCCELHANCSEVFPEEEEIQAKDELTECMEDISIDGPSEEVCFSAWLGLAPDSCLSALAHNPNVPD